MVSPLTSSMRTAMTQFTGVSSGDAKQAMLQALGWNQRDAALSGAMHDLRRGDLAGYQKNMFEAFTGVDPGKLAGGMCQAHSMCSPAAYQGASVQRMDLKHLSKSSFGAKALGFALGGPIGMMIGNALGKRKNAKCLEKRLNRNPMFRAQFEAMVGGKYVPDGRNDGKITIVRNNFQLPGLNRGCFGALGGNMVAGGALSGLARMMGNAAGLMQAIGGGGLSGFGYGGLNTNQNLKTAMGFDRQSGGPGSAVARLPPNATFEDLVSAFMIDTVKDMQDEAKAKMDEIRQSNQSRAGDRRGYGGMLGGLGGMAGGVLGGMVGGPVGSMIGKGIGQAAGSAIGGGGAGGAGGAQGKGDDSRNLMFEELKNIMNKLQQMQQAMSNVLNTMHQGAMNSIRNIRA